MTKKQQIQEGLIDKAFNALKRGIETNRKKANRKAMRDPKVQKKFRDIKKNLDRLSNDLDDIMGI